MSLTIPRTFRTPIAQSIEPSNDGNCAVRHETVLEMADAICAKIFGPSDYEMVSLMNSVSEQLSNIGMAKATENLELATSLLIAACEIGRAADKLDRHLIDKMVERFELEAQA